MLFKTFEKRTLDNQAKYGEDKDNNLYFYKKLVQMTDRIQRDTPSLVETSLH